MPDAHEKIAKRRVMTDCLGMNQQFGVPRPSGLQNEYGPKLGTASPA
jgi:hypothetical protein